MFKKKSKNSFTSLKRTDPFLIIFNPFSIFPFLHFFSPKIPRKEPILTLKTKFETFHPIPSPPLPPAEMRFLERNTRRLSGDITEIERGQNVSTRNSGDISGRRSSTRGKFFSILAPDRKRAATLSQRRRDRIEE